MARQLNKCVMEMGWCLGEARPMFLLLVDACQSNVLPLAACDRVAHQHLKGLDNLDCATSMTRQQRIESS